VGYTAGDLDVWREVMARVMTAAGARRGDLLHVAFGYGLFTGGLGFHDGGERMRHDGGAGLVRQHRAPSSAAAGLPSRRHLRHALVRAPHRRESA
jgi:hypothetical protein